LEILLRREPYGALGTSVTRVFTLPLGKEAFAGPAVPIGLCREYLGLCRVELALGIAPDSGSGEPESEREREWCMAWHVTCTLHSCNHIAAPDKHESKMQAILGLCEVKL
jgi:hypothetical protein